VAAFPQNPYISGHINSVLITSEVYKLQLKNEDQTEIATDTIVIKYRLKPFVSKMFVPVYQEEDASMLSYHSFYYRALNDNVCVFVHPINQEYIDSFVVYLKEMEPPTHLDYDDKKIITSSNNWKTCFPSNIFTTIGVKHLGIHHNTKRGISVYIYRFSLSCPWVTIFLHSRELNLKL
jgi:hypothetical protein